MPSARAQELDVEYVQGDMRKLPWRDRFDGLVNWFTSFGYFSDEQNKAVLRQFHDALRRAGASSSRRRTSRASSSSRARSTGWSATAT